MAVTVVASTAWTFAASTSTAPTTSMPTGWAAGDMLVLLLAYKQIAASPSSPAGWSNPATSASANGAAYAAGAGDTRIHVFTRIAQVGDTAPTIAALTGGSTTTTTGNVVGAQITAFRSGTGLFTETASTIALVNGAQSTSATAWSIAMGWSNILKDDLIFFAVAPSLSTATITSPSLAITGMTVAALTLAQAAGSSAIGADIATSAWWTRITDGAVPTAMTATMTLSAATYGALQGISLREQQPYRQRLTGQLKQAVARSAVY